MINPVFTENQMKIINSDSYPVYLKGAAGSGKTEVLINKILHILKSDKEASLDNMVIITFTNRAVDEIQERFSLLLAQNCTVDKKLQNQMDLTYISNISAIHSFCEKLLREYGLSEVYNQYKTKEITAAEAMKKLNLKHTIFYRFVKEEKNNYAPAS